MNETTAYIGLGANLGDRAGAIAAAVERLRATPGVRVVAVSDLIETEPVGGPPGQGRYLNAAAGLACAIGPKKLLRTLQRIEAEGGRERASEPRWGPRRIDLDLLLFGERVIDGPSLTVPHPRLHERRFVLEPLCRIAPKARDPRRGESVESLLSALDRVMPDGIPHVGDVFIR